MDGVILTPLKQITHLKGNIFHAMKASDDGFSGFGEAYFSTVNKFDIKGWKKHTNRSWSLSCIMGLISLALNYQKIIIKG